MQNFKKKLKNKRNECWKLKKYFVLWRLEKGYQHFFC